MANGLFNVVHEIWKSTDFPGYEVSNLGRVRSIERWLTYSSGQRVFYPGKILRQFTLWNGYITTHLGSNNMNKYVHHLVAKAWLGECPDELEICHNNNNKNFNWVINLRFDTRKGNMDDRPIKWQRVVNGVLDKSASRHSGGKKKKYVIKNPRKTGLFRALD